MSERAVRRPTIYSEELGLRICALIAEGYPLTKICKRDEMPALTTVYRWLTEEDKAKFRDIYEMARQDQADTLADQILEIADDGENDSYETEDRNGDTITVTRTEVIQRSRLRVDARKWIAAKLKPRKYGDQMQPDALSIAQILEALAKGREGALQSVGGNIA